MEQRKKERKENNRLFFLSGADLWSGTIKSAGICFHPGWWQSGTLLRPRRKMWSRERTPRSHWCDLELNRGPSEIETRKQKGLKIKPDFRRCKRNRRVSSTRKKKKKKSERMMRCSRTVGLLGLSRLTGKSVGVMKRLILFEGPFRKLTDWKGCLGHPRLFKSAETTERVPTRKSAFFKETLLRDVLRRRAT